MARGLHSHTWRVLSCMMRTCSPVSEPRYMHSGPKGKSEPCVHRESPTGRVIIVIVAEREKTREMERREKRRGENRERRKERARKKEKAENPSVCRFKTPPCVRSRRLHVQHTRAFSACQAAPHNTHNTNITHNTDTIHTRQHHNTHHMRTTMSTHTSHIHVHIHVHTPHNAQSTTDRDLETKT